MGGRGGTGGTPGETPIQPGIGGGAAGFNILPVQYNNTPLAAGIKCIGVGFVFNFDIILNVALNPDSIGFGFKPIKLASTGENPGTCFGNAPITA